MAKQGCEKLGLESFDALVRRARTCRRFDESMRVPREFLLELAELAHLAPCGANAQRLRFHVVSDVEECSSLFEKLTWAGALKDWSGPNEGERPTGYIAVLAERTVPGKPAAPITEVDTGIAAQTMMLAARSATPEVAACMFKAFTPRAIDAMGLDNDRYELKLIMAFGVPAETQVIDAIDSKPGWFYQLLARRGAGAPRSQASACRRAGVVARHFGVIRRQNHHKGACPLCGGARGGRVADLYLVRHGQTELNVQNIFAGLARLAAHRARVRAGAGDARGV